MKFLIIKLSALGDQIHLSPAISDLASCHPKSTIHWVTQTECAEIPEMHRDVSKVFRLPLRELRNEPWKISRWVDFLKIILALRSDCYDLVIDAQGVLKSAVFSRLVKSKRVFGFSAQNVSEAGANWFYTETFSPARGISAVERARGLVHAATGCLPLVVAQYRLGPATVAALNHAASRDIWLVPCASSFKKHWPVENWVALIRSHRSNLENFQLVWGSVKDRELVDQIAHQAGGRAKPVPHRYSISQLAGLIKEAKLVIGVDSGITHLANALGVPTIMIFTSTRPDLFFFSGSPYSLSIGGCGTKPEVKDVLDCAQNFLYRVND